MNRLRDAARALLCVAGMLALFEMGMRLAGLHYQGSMYMPDAERGYALRPHSHGWDVEENQNYVEINSAGMRDREHALTRPAGTLRIAVIGDSMVEARQVPLEQTFASVMEKQLGECAPHGQKIEVLNFAVPGYSLAQDWLTLRNQVGKYDPQVVVLGMSMATAVTKNVRVLDPGDTHGTPVYELKDGKLVADADTRARIPLGARALYWKNVTSDWMNASDLLLLLNEARIHMREPVAKVRELLRPSNAGGAPAADAPPRDFAAKWPYLGPVNPTLQKAWEVTEALLLAMRNECAAQHRQFWIVTLDMAGQVHPDVREREKLERELGVPSLELADERVARFANEHRIRHLMLAPIMAEYAARNHVALHGFAGEPLNAGHWNEVGHRVAGERIALEICAHWTW